MKDIADLLGAENKWGRLEGHLEPKVRAVFTKKEFEFEKVEMRFVGVTCDQLYPRDRDYRKLAKALSEVVGEIKGYVDKTRCISINLNSKLKLLAYYVTGTKKNATPKKAASVGNEKKKKRSATKRSTKKRKKT